MAVQGMGQLAFWTALRASWNARTPAEVGESTVIGQHGPAMV
jgi:hypothetical protein